MTQRVTVIIPARMDSSRLPGKVLAEIGGEPMVWHVYRAAAVAVGKENVIVATDSPEVAEAIISRGGLAVITDRPVDSGTARCAAALESLGISEGIIVNLQADEPLISPEDILCLVNAFDDPRTGIATLSRRFDPAEGWDALFSPDNPKVVMDADGFALYFSRSIIPYVRDCHWKNWARSATFHIHVGMYAFRRDVLAAVAALPPAPLEQTERLEQLRWLSAGYRIKVAETTRKSLSVDTEADLDIARAFYNKQFSDNR